MDTRTALRSAAIYRLGATVAFLIGAGIAGIGMYVGGGLPMLRALPPGDPILNVAHVTNAIPGMILALVGLVVWQFGSATAHYYTLADAAGRESAESFDSEKVKSDILAVLDERLAEIHDDVEATRRAVGGGSNPSGRSAGRTSQGRSDDAGTDSTTGGTEPGESPAADDGSGSADDHGSSHPGAPRDRDGSERGPPTDRRSEHSQGGHSPSGR